jgi:hypothetical protein
LASAGETSIYETLVVSTGVSSEHPAVAARVTSSTTIGIYHFIATSSWSLIFRIIKYPAYVYEVDIIRYYIFIKFSRVSPDLPFSLPGLNVSRRNGKVVIGKQR